MLVTFLSTCSKNERLHQLKVAAIAYHNDLDYWLNNRERKTCPANALFKKGDQCLSFLPISSVRAMFVLLNNCTEAGISDRHNIKIDHNCTMEGHFGFMLNTIDDDNRFPAGVEDDPLKMLHRATMYQASGYASVDRTKKDLQNIIDAKRRTLFSDFDVDAIISYMTAKSELDTQFFYNYQLNEDGMSCNDYRIFGDVLYFDTTYKTNAYRRPLVIFVKVNHHNKPTVFGFELLVDETVETYSWILKTFLSAMHGKCLTLVVTNGNKSMRKAIKAEMSGSVHQLYSWHLQQNAQTNLGDTDFTRAFSHCIVAFMTKSEFETKWHASIDWFRLHGNAWVTKMNSKCKQLKLYKFMRQIDRTIVRLHHSKIKDDFDTLNEHPILVTHLELLEKRHAVELYTWGIFQLVRDEIKEEAKLSVRIAQH
ncbi:hypothetical protein JRO89_XS10G0109100 [Xanthoceras sorbifolium]|uniref:MULE transposase domain-containing protein n=1 Tax=Xanthoceras sorbifolium TaxID=99658 RepID=A0ABQ8HIA6_9ROSI|nr:hypothetical protein JRO89_XS10G0109100 [Xanthoceras sorbifolium]